MIDQRFPKSARLRRQAEFDLVYREDSFAADDVLVIRARRNGKPTSRLGLSVSRKVGNAVVRNRWKRIIREAFRRQRRELPTGLDLVIRPKKGARCEFAAVERSLGRLALRLNRKLSREVGPS